VDVLGVCLGQCGGNAGAQVFRLAPDGNGVALVVGVGNDDGALGLSHDFVCVLARQEPVLAFRKRGRKLLKGGAVFLNCGLDSLDHSDNRRTISNNGDFARALVESQRDSSPLRSAFEGRPASLHEGQNVSWDVLDALGGLRTLLRDDAVDELLSLVCGWLRARD
jgi:hypothetical protein